MMRMKRIYYLLGLLLLTGCSKEEHTEALDNNDCLQIGKAVLASNGEVSPWTEASLGVSLLSPGEMLNAGASFYNVELRYTENGWVSQPVLRWPDNAEGTVCDVVAYAPYLSTLSDPSAVPLSLAADQSQQGAPQQNDWLYSRSSMTKTGSGEPVQLELQHALSRLVFEVIFDGDYIGTEGIQSLSVSLKNNGTVDLNDGTVSVQGSSTAMSPCLLEVAPQGVSQCYELTVLPQEVSSDGVFVAFSVNGKSFEKSVSARFEAGKCYTYRLRIGRDIDPVLLALDPISIAQWEEEKVDLPQAGMDPEEYQAGDLWPNAENPIAYVVRARESHRPGIMVTIVDKKGTPFMNGGWLTSLEYQDPNNGGMFQAGSSLTDGIINMETMKILLSQQSDPALLSWKNFPALDYVRTLGPDWFIPAGEQWQTILDQIEPEVWSDLLANYWTVEFMKWTDGGPGFGYIAVVYSSTLRQDEDGKLKYVNMRFYRDTRQTEMLDQDVDFTTESYNVIAVRYF